MVRTILISVIDTTEPPLSVGIRLWLINDDLTWEEVDWTSPAFLMVSHWQNYPSSTLSPYNSGDFWNLFMKIEIHTRLTIGNTTALKSLWNIISNLSFVTGYPPYIESPKKYVRMKNLKNSHFSGYDSLSSIEYVNFIKFWQV